MTSRANRTAAEREVCRALSERAAVVKVALTVVLAHVAALALFAHQGWLWLVASVLWLVTYGAVAAHAEPPKRLEREGAIARMSEPDFQALIEDVEREGAILRGLGRGRDLDGFERMVRDALDELPEFVRAELRDVPVLVSDDGHEHGRHGYLGMYAGRTVADRGHPNRIHVFRDTLVGHYGADPDRLRRQVRITLRHEVAHHFGAGERRVRDLGL